MVKLIALLSPAKTLDFESLAPVDDATDCMLLDEAQSLVAVLKKLDAAALAKLMKLSPALAELNVERYQSWRPQMTEQNSKQALFAFKGDVYSGLDAASLTAKQIRQAQGQLRILSGLYGLLKPLDRIQPYRLEMGTRLATPQGVNLYQFWGERITKLLAEQLAAAKADYLLNLASQEYFKVIKTADLEVPIIDVRFLEEKNGDYRFISFFAKKARGLMMRYILDQQPSSVTELQAFNYAGYAYCKAQSSPSEWVFTRSQVVAQ